MPRDSIQTPWDTIATGALAPEAPLVAGLVASTGLSPADRARIVASGADLVSRIRASAKPGLMEVFLAEYGLSTDEGVALMCLAEALLRVPDAAHDGRADRGQDRALGLGAPTSGGRRRAWSTPRPGR